MLIDILKKPVNHRDPMEEILVLKTASFMPFFHKIVGDHGIQTVEKSFKYLQYERFDKGSIVFHKGK